MTNMIKLVDVRKTKTIELPSYPGSKIELYSELNTKDQREIALLVGDKDQVKVSLSMVTKLIKDWNFADEEGNKLEVTIENLEILPQKDYEKLFEAITNKSIDELKELGSKKKEQ